ncbi:MAG: carbohydrate ABC transporter permease [Clostridia bacterium]|nr:carbohydrate ABC transporter permease [Clostridia bacterium]
MAKAKQKKGKLSVFTCILCGILILYCIMLLVPWAWGLMSSFKSKWDLRSNMFGLPKEWMFSNYTVVLNRFTVTVESSGPYPTRAVGILEMSYNSIVYSVGMSLSGTFVGAVMAYATARYRYKFSAAIYALVLATMILPLIGSLPSQLQVARALNLHDSMVGIFVMKSYFGGMFYLVFYGTFTSVPQDYTDVAEIDGAGQLTVMLRIIFPFAKSVFFSVFLLNFISYWNDYQTPLLFVPNRPTLAYGLWSFANANHNNDIKTVPTQLAGCFMMAIPILLLYLLAQNKMMENVSMGGLKG